MAASTTCIYCGAALSRPGAQYCPACGRSQVAATPAPQAASAPMPATVIGTAPAAPPSIPPPAAPPTVGAQHAVSLQPTAPVGATITVQDGGQTRLLTLGNRPLTLGRAADNDIVSGSRFVSGHHARIEPNGAAHRIVDVGSTNGLLFEGRRLLPNAPHDLFDGDVLRIGDPATGSFVSLSYRNPLAARAGAEQAAQSYRLDPNDAQITIGRAGCDITLDNPQVSRFHAQIDRLSDGRHLLRDGGATNGVFVNGQRLSGQQPLRPGDIIQIGPFKLVYSGSSLDQYDQRGALRIDVRNLSRAVRRGGTTRLILKDVSLSIAPREFVALVGGSGTGKSTLMNAMSGYARATSGTVAVNGDDYYRNFDAYRTVLGYVPQDDIIHRTIQVSSALGYAARLRLPADTAQSEITQRIGKVLEDVEMTPHRDNLVDNLSGGQRKRVSIGVELLADPSLFFLDEPTSGLDPGLEKKMMYTLRRLADSGRTVVLVTHATANITQCDHVAFMADGRMVYFGPPAEALPFFGVGTGDFADIYTKLEGTADAANPIAQRDLQAELKAWQAANPQAKTPPPLAELWELKFRASEQYRRYVVERLTQAPQGLVVAASGTGATQRRKGASPLRQLGILTRRYADLMLQDRRNLFILLLQAPVIGLLLLIVARSDSIVGVEAAQNQAKKVLFMLAVVAVWFGIINAAREITKEATIYRRERLANLRIGPYVLSKLFVLAGLVLVQSAVLLALVALKVKFPDAGVFLPIWLELFITTLLTSLAGLALGLVISAFASTPDRAISIVPLALIPQIVFAGLIFDITGIATPLSWLTISRWAMDGYGSIVDLNALPAVAGVFGAGAVEGRYSHTPGHLLLTWLVLLIYGAICMGITAALLKRRDRQI